MYQKRISRTNWRPILPLFRWIQRPPNRLVMHAVSRSRLRHNALAKDSPTLPDCKEWSHSVEGGMFSMNQVRCSEKVDFPSEAKVLSVLFVFRRASKREASYRYTKCEILVYNQRRGNQLWNSFTSRWYQSHQFGLMYRCSKLLWICRFTFETTSQTELWDVLCLLSFQNLCSSSKKSETLMILQIR